MAIKAKASQEFVPVNDIKNGIVKLKDGSLRAVLMASSVNFSLKSDDERTAILYQFQDFLNSLDFSVQISIQSRKLDIRPYIALLEETEKKQVNDLMKIQVQEYIGFIKNFTENHNIMTKHFFVIVPYSPATLQGKNTVKELTGFFGKNKNDESKKISEQEKFEENRTQLEQRLSIVEQGLVRSGIRVVQLGTEEIVELFYKIFNPGDAEKPIQLQ
jgi:hypothetical protein